MTPALVETGQQTQNSNPWASLSLPRPLRPWNKILELIEQNLKTIVLVDKMNKSSMSLDHNLCQGAINGLQPPAKDLLWPWGGWPSLGLLESHSLWPGAAWSRASWRVKWSDGAPWSPQGGCVFPHLPSAPPCCAEHSWRDTCASWIPLSADSVKITRCGQGNHTSSRRNWPSVGTSGWAQLPVFTYIQKLLFIGGRMPL